MSEQTNTGLNNEINVEIIKENLNENTSEKKEEVFDNFKGLDISFVIDTTGSMGPYIEFAKQTVHDTITSVDTELKKSYPDAYFELLKISIVTYRDHPPQENTYLTQQLNFTYPQTALEYLTTSVSPSGGGDFPEAVMDGLNEAVNKTSWRKETDKMLFLILDAPPHGIRYGTYYDCPCGITEKNFMEKIVKDEIELHVIRIPNVEGISNMITEFRKYTKVEEKLLEAKSLNFTVPTSLSVSMGSYIKSDEPYSCDIKSNLEEKSCLFTNIESPLMENLSPLTMNFNNINTNSSNSNAGMFQNEMSSYVNCNIQRQINFRQNQKKEN